MDFFWLCRQEELFQARLKVCPRADCEKDGLEGQAPVQRLNRNSRQVWKQHCNCTIVMIKTD